ncbi:FadR/GntR family transcriptional regulator [Nocardiopsis nanhaiensis]
MSRLSTSARRVVFAPLDDGTGRGEAVARRLAKAISLGLIADGEQLPSESDMATALNVSTVTLRDALSSLRGQGLVETRRGRGGGSFARASAEILGDRALARLLEMATPDLRELGDYHAAISGTAARLAAERASADHVTRLRDIVCRLAEASAPGTQQRLAGRFHIEVAATAQSVRLTSQEFDVQAEVGALAWVPNHTARTHGETVDTHQAVTDAIEAHDGTRARELTEQHVEALTQGLIEIHFNLVKARS